MAGKKKHVMRAEGASEDRKALDWLLMEKRMEAARRLKPGWHTFYVFRAKHRYAVSVKRKLDARYPYLARFVDKNGLGESFTYAELANMIIKPDPGIEVITEAEERRRNLDE